MRTLFTIIFLGFITVAFAQPAIHVAPYSKEVGDSIIVKHKLDSIAALTAIKTIKLTEAQKAKLAEYDAAPQRMQEALQKINEEKVKYLLGILDGDTASDAVKDTGKISGYEIKDGKLELKVLKGYDKAPK